MSPATTLCPFCQTLQTSPPASGAEMICSQCHHALNAANPVPAKDTHPDVHLADGAQTMPEQAPAPAMGILEKSKKKRGPWLTGQPVAPPPGLTAPSTGPEENPLRASLPTPSATPPAASSAGAKWLVLGLGGLLALGGGVLGAYFLFSKPPTTDITQAKDRGLDIIVPPVPKKDPGASESKKEISDPKKDLPAKGTVPGGKDVAPVVKKEPAGEDEPPKFGPIPSKNKKSRMPGEDDEGPPVFVLDLNTRKIAGVDQAKINAAIDRGVKYLKITQDKSGGWAKQQYQVGYAALPGLTLLECGVPAKDPQVQAAAALVRTQVPDLDHTYQLSLAILFLDKLGDPRDKVLIQAMALRLIAGQTVAGGWNYNVPKLKGSELQQLLTFLEKTRPKHVFPDPLAKGGDPLKEPLPQDGDPLKDPLAKNRDLLKDPLVLVDPKLTDPLGKKEDPNFPNPLTGPRETLPSPLQGSGQGTGNNNTGQGNQPGGAPKDLPKNQDATVGPELLPFPTSATEPGKIPGQPGGPATKTDLTKIMPKTDPKAKMLPKGTPVVLPRPDFLPENLRKVPAVVNLGPKGKGKGKIDLLTGRDDNSNSQFAMLALWAARRHGVPAERTLLLAHQRYVESQKPDGWGYQVHHGVTPSMTCVGLLGLAVGHGADQPQVMNKKDAVVMKVAPQDDNIQRGLRALGNYIGSPSTTDYTGPMANLYFLWSVERVAMLYNLKTIGNKDWYGWGAQILLKHQRADGSWVGGQYPGSSQVLDTCLALLFLKRSNLVQDLTDNLQLFMAITDPDAKR